MQTRFWNKKVRCRSAVAFLVLSVFFLSPLQVNGIAMTSTNYQVEADSLSSGGVYAATSTNYQVGSTLGEFFAFTATSTNRRSYGGFWQMIGNEVSLSLNTTAIALGILSRGETVSVSQTATASSTFSNGYALTIVEDGNLRTGTGADIDDVADGAVSAGSEEYGIRTSGTDGQFNSTDTSITGSAKTIATRAAPANSVVTTISYKAAVNDGTATGDYSHIVTLSLTSVF